jgi:DHA1 family bicyclomycin/chloramphenicol resistance-like MFS transporter
VIHTRETLPIKGGMLIALLTALAALGQFASSVYLPSMPAMEQGLNASTSAVQFTMTAYLAGFAIMQLVYGPLADRYGRRPIMLVGLVLFLIGSVMCFAATGIETVIIGRAVQAMGACAGVVASRATTRDLFDGPELTKVMAAIAMAFSIFPAVAPILGGYLQETIGWQASFAASAIFGVAVLVPSLLFLRETNRSQMARLDVASIWQGYKIVASNKQFRSFAFTVSAVMGALFAFLTGSPAALVGDGLISPMEYGLYPALTIPGFIVTGIIVRKTVEKVGDAALMRRGAWLTLAGGALMVALPLLGFTGVARVLIPMGVFVCGMGFVFSVGHAGALRNFPERAGVASALMGVVQVGTAAVASALVALLADLGPLSFPISMFVCTGAAAVFSRGCR